MPLYVFFFIRSIRKLNLEGSVAFKRMPPGKSKIGKRSLCWLFRVASSSYQPPALPPLSLPVATPGKVSAAATEKIRIEENRIEYFCFPSTITINT
jgi:hypothetical protein